MLQQLRVSIGQYSDKGRKQINQDFHGAFIPTGSQLDLKGVSLALADGISSSQVSQIASEVSVKTFLEDYYCTSDAWSVKTSAMKVLQASNSWLYSQTYNSPHRYDKDKGYVCTLSTLTIKSHAAHIFHVGDSRVYKQQGDQLKQITKDHRLWVSEEKSYLSNALGINEQCDFDYHTLDVEEGDCFVLATDGIYEFVSEKFILNCIKQYADDLNLAAHKIGQFAFENGSDDNLTIQIARIDCLPTYGLNEVKQQLDRLALPAILQAPQIFDGYEIIRDLYSSSRSHVYLAQDIVTQNKVVLKIPSIDLRHDETYLERFLAEEWIARRINSPYVLKASPITHARNFVYTVNEYIEGQTLKQWLLDHPKPSLEMVRNIIEQVAKGLRVFHRQEMLHQDIRPENIMIDASGTVKIIDFGSTQVAGLTETQGLTDQALGTTMYMAPEYFLGEMGSVQSEQFSLAVLTYYMLSGRFPYGNKVAQSRTVKSQRALQYKTVLSEDREIPVWIDDTLQKALQPFAHKRYEDLTEFVYDLRHPNQTYINKVKPPFIERSPVAFWQGVSGILLLVLLYLLANPIHL